MRRLRAEQMAALFERRAGEGRSAEEQAVGDVYCLTRNLECVPIRFQDLRLMLEVSIPYYLTQVDFYEDILLKTRSGGFFIPKLEHRFLNLAQVDPEGEVSNICEARPEALNRDKIELADVIRNALLTYYRSYPNANQYFYLYDAPVMRILDLVFKQIPPALLERYDFVHYPDLAEPYAGFSLTSKAL